MEFRDYLKKAKEIAVTVWMINGLVNFGGFMIYNKNGRTSEILGKLQDTVKILKEKDILTEEGFRKKMAECNRLEKQLKISEELIIERFKFDRYFLNKAYTIFDFGFPANLASKLDAKLKMGPQEYCKTE